MLEPTSADPVAVFHAEGFVPLRSIVDAELLGPLREGFEAKLRSCLEIIAASGQSFGVGAREGFREIVRRHEKRFEMTFGAEVAELVDSGGVDGDLAEPIRQILAAPALDGVVRGILGDDCRLIGSSLVVSLPGAEDQKWHEDGPHLTQKAHLPCHVLNVFVPLCAVLSEDVGPTELRPGSHFYTRKPNQWLAAVARKEWRAAERPLLDLGDVLLFDYRVQHRGRANRSCAPRPILVLTFAKPFFRDILNFPPTRSIHGEAPVPS